MGRQSTKISKNAPVVSFDCDLFQRYNYFILLCSLQGGGTSTLNYCKVDLLPQDLYVLATDIIEKYQNGELSPSVESGQLLLV